MFAFALNDEMQKTKMHPSNFVSVFSPSVRFFRGLSTFAAWSPHRNCRRVSRAEAEAHHIRAKRISEVVTSFLHMIEPKANAKNKLIGFVCVSVCACAVVCALNFPSFESRRAGRVAEKCPVGDSKHYLSVVSRGIHPYHAPVRPDRQTNKQNENWNIYYGAPFDGAIETYTLTHTEMEFIASAKAFAYLAFKWKTQLAAVEMFSFHFSTRQIHKYFYSQFIIG